jgi:CHASE3 domain sensor protein
MAEMKISIRKKLFLFALIVFAVNGILGYAVYESNERLLDSEQGVQHTEEVIYQAVKIQSASKNIETSAGNYVITQDGAFLKPLYAAQKTIFDDIGQPCAVYAC